MNTVAIVQARMTSTRLPGKVLMDVGDAPMLAQEVRRLRRSARVDEIVVATTTNDSDEPVVACAQAEGARWFRGSAEDVLGRYLEAAREAAAGVVVRLTADCPLIDPEVVDRVVAELTPEVDYASNVLERTFPVGLDVEALHMDTLERLGRLATSGDAREHVTWFLRTERPELFVRRSVADDEDNSDLRWTVDDEADLEHVRRLYHDLGLAREPRSYRDVVAYERRS